MVESLPDYTFQQWCSRSDEKRAIRWPSQTVHQSRRNRG